MAGDFAGDAALNVAIIHASSASASTPFGGVTVLRGDGAGVLELQPNYYQVGALPIDSVTSPSDIDRDKSSTRLPSEPPQSQLVIRSGISPAIDIDTPIDQSLVQTGTRPSEVQA